MQTSLFENLNLIRKKTVEGHRDRLYNQFAGKLKVNPELTRSLVSFQENKAEPFYRWLKYKEAFSSKLVKYFLAHFDTPAKYPLRVLDPFAGTGTTLTTSASKGHHATGIELLPVGVSAIRARLAADTVDINEFQKYLDKLKNFPLEPSHSEYSFPHLRITEKAFPPHTERELSAYRFFLDQIENEQVRYLFWFACLSILEEISFTNKDGQYLRWDHRSGRVLRSKYQKKTIREFREAVHEKLGIMLEDIKNRNGGSFSTRVKIVAGSCLTELVNFSDNSIDLIITSPPYCNRYDYTRSYALELAFLGFSEEDVKQLRQTLLSATVENRTKREHLAATYARQNRESAFDWVVDGFNFQEALQEVLSLLYAARENGKLNNNNIPQMVASYFFEMNFVVHEMARILSPGGRVYMVNDNVQYVGEEIPVDLILSDLAEHAGLRVDHIWILPRGKGNSSQQMGNFGRKELRKCVYVWSKPANTRLKPAKGAKISTSPRFSLPN